MNLFAINSRLSEAGRLRSNILRMSLLLLLVIIPLFWLATKQGNIDNRIDSLVVLAWIGCLVALIFNRLGWVILAGIIVVAVLVASIDIYMFTDSEPVVTAQIVGSMLSIPVIFSGIIIGSLAPPVVTVITLIILVTWGFVSNNLGTTFGNVISTLAVPFFIVLLVGILSWFFEYNFERVLKQVTQRNEELENSNEELANKRDKDLEIGEQITVLAARVSGAFAEQNRGANDQLAAVVEVTSAIEELNQTNEQIASASSQVARGAQEALMMAERGEETIRNSMGAIAFLQSKVENIVLSMQGLSSQALEIDQIIELITDVAEETNLLALNATIEAAGAREYGRRFAAVAGEVQRLANRSREAADQVRVVVSEVQDAVRVSTSATQEGLRDALSVSNSAREIGTAIEGMVKMVQNTATLAQQISLSIQQQKSAGGQIVETMRQISDVSQNVALSSHELLESIFHLNEAADRLREASTTLIEEDADDQFPIFPVDGGNQGLQELRSSDLLQTH